MSQELINKVEEYVIHSFTKDGIFSTRGKHLLDTYKWLLIIFPEADEAMKIAAVSHDIDSAFKDYKIKGKYKDEQYLKVHQETSANVIEKFLLENNADKDLIKNVKHLVSKHEVGGDFQQNIIKDADSIAFFDRDFHEFINRHIDNGKESIKEKFDWMYERITSKEAKAIAEPMYKKGLKILEAINEN